jgi:hypothetical protein
LLLLQDCQFLAYSISNTRWLQRIPSLLEVVDAFDQLFFDGSQRYWCRHNTITPLGVLRVASLFNFYLAVIGCFDRAIVSGFIASHQSAWLNCLLG